MGYNYNEKLRASFIEGDKYLQDGLVTAIRNLGGFIYFKESLDEYENTKVIVSKTSISEDQLKNLFSIDEEEFQTI